MCLGLKAKNYDNTYNEGSLLAVLIEEEFLKNRIIWVERISLWIWYYEVVNIDGDYANLRRTDVESDDLKLVARALLPPEIVEGSRLKYEMMTYSLET